MCMLKTTVRSWNDFVFTGVFALGGLGTVSNSSLSQFNRGSSTADEAELVAETQEEYRVGARKRWGQNSNAIALATISSTSVQFFMLRDVVSAHQWWSAVQNGCTIHTALPPWETLASMICSQSLTDRRALRVGNLGLGFRV